MRPLALLACLALAALALPSATAAAPTGEPNASDPDGDGVADALDLQKMWVSANATHLLVSLQVKDLPDLPASTSGCPDGCASETLSFRVEFRVERTDGKPAPTMEGYNSTYLVYRHGADDAALRTQMGWLGEARALTFTGNPDVTVADNVVTFAVPRSDDVVNMPAGAATGYVVRLAYAYDSPQTCQTQEEWPAGVSNPGAPAPCASVARPNPGGAAPIGWDRMPDADYAKDLVLPAPAPAPQPAPPVTTSTSTSASTTADAPPAQTATGTDPPSPTPEPKAPAARTTTAPPAKGSPAAPAVLLLAGLAGLAAARRRLT